MLTTDYKAKLVDFGLSKYLLGGTKKTSIHGFSERYSAREYLEEEIVSYKNDIWSFGLLIYEIFSLN